jgi:erythromycin esterase-like protein
LYFAILVLNINIKNIMKNIDIRYTLNRTMEPFDSIEDVSLDRLLKRLKHAKVVLLGEATHGTAEFYTMRSKITKALIEKLGFNLVAVEADWPDAAAVNRYIKNKSDKIDEKSFTRFPFWMWRNTQMQEFISWLRQYNFNQGQKQVGFYGLDLYSLYASIETVLKYLQEVDPQTADIARHKYGCLEPWEDPAAYGAAAISGHYESCEGKVVDMLKDILSKQVEYARNDGLKFFDAVANARLIADAEHYYRIMYYGAPESWNWRDKHMFETLKSLMTFHGPQSKVVIWEHNSHVGDMRATQMSKIREVNVGQMCREHFGQGAYLIGFGTDHGRVAAASSWDGNLEIKDIKPAHPESYEGLFHTFSSKQFLLPLNDLDTRAVLIRPHLERAIGVIYRPETEMQSHYFWASLPKQFDEYIWFDETKPVTPLQTTQPPTSKEEETFPFGV